MQPDQKPPAEPPASGKLPAIILWAVGVGWWLVMAVVCHHLGSGGALADKMF